MHIPRSNLISIFARHRIAANLLMLVMIIAGLWSLTRINVQFLPSINISDITITVRWPGASAEDVENSIINPIEKGVRNIDNLKRMTSTSRNSFASILLEFHDGTDMPEALEKVREAVSQVRSLPRASEPPVITRLELYESIADILISGPETMAALRHISRRFERDLLNRGIARITIFGLPEQEIAIQIPMARLVELNLSLNQIASLIGSQSLDLPAGTLGRSEVGRRIRSLDQRRTIHGFENLPIKSDDKGRIIHLRDIAQISLRPRENQVQVYYQDKSAAVLRLQRTTAANALTSANIMHKWLKTAEAEAGKSLNIIVYNENWQLIKDRINLLLKNGVTGLILIILLMFLALNRYVAFWIIMGIPASFLASILILYSMGYSIDMVSLFAFIMSLGIIVDDTIVVGEQALTNIQNGQAILPGIEDAAYKMVPPIMASSLTTVCAFLPLLLVGDIIGKILIVIPIVVICVIFASLIECFLVLPGHLHHSFRTKTHIKDSTARKVINSTFDKFKTEKFKPFLRLIIHHRHLTIISVLALMLLAISLVSSGILSFTFFPSPEGPVVYANAEFTIGTPPAKVKAYLREMERTLKATNKALSPKNKSLIKTYISFTNLHFEGRRNTEQGEQYAAMSIELLAPDSRKVTNAEFIRAWRKRLKTQPGIEDVTIYTPRGGPPGDDIDIELKNTNSRKLKLAAEELKNTLRTFKGVSAIRDDLPFGQNQFIYSLNATGESLGLTTEDIGVQLRAAFNGHIAQIYHVPNEEIEVRVILPDNERNQLATLRHYPIVTPKGNTVPLETVADISFKQSPELIRHSDTELAVRVQATVDANLNNANEILVTLKKISLKKLETKYNLTYLLRGRAEEQKDTLQDMEYGLILGLCLIYIILAWVFSSYGWPLLVMAVIPLGLTGAIFGHYLMGLDLTILSLFGLFGLSGIIINDSIILLNEYRLLREEGIDVETAIIEASSRRLRAVLLTSLTTIAGLTPLLFERSMQAQFLIPMATSISFGLAYGTILILGVVPVLLSYYESVRRRIKVLAGK
jgi:multidrug efflux pump subunit AcrB